VRKMLCGNKKIIYSRFILLSMRNGRLCKSRDEISIRGKGYNTLGVKHALALALHDHKHHWAFMSISMSNFIFIHLLVSHVCRPLKLYLC
jgi:hypothetical protein